MKRLMKALDGGSDDLTPEDTLALKTIDDLEAHMGRDLTRDEALEVRARVLAKESQPSEDGAVDKFVDKLDPSQKTALKAAITVGEIVVGMLPISTGTVPFAGEYAKARISGLPPKEAAKAGATGAAIDVGVRLATGGLVSGPAAKAATKAGSLVSKYIVSLPPASAKQVSTKLIGSMLGKAGVSKEATELVMSKPQVLLRAKEGSAGVGSLHEESIKAIDLISAHKASLGQAVAKSKALVQNAPIRDVDALSSDIGNTVAEILGPVSKEDRAARIMAANVERIFKTPPKTAGEYYKLVDDLKATPVMDRIAKLPKGTPLSQGEAASKVLVQKLQALGDNALPAGPQKDALLSARSQYHELTKTMTEAGLNKTTAQSLSKAGRSAIRQTQEKQLESIVKLKEMVPGAADNLDNILGISTAKHLNRGSLSISGVVQALGVGLAKKVVAPTVVEKAAGSIVRQAAVSGGTYLNSPTPTLKTEGEL